MMNGAGVPDRAHHHHDHHLLQIIDISQPLRRGIPVWPGDQRFEPNWSARIDEGSSVNVGALTLSLHTGTHADAPLHVKNAAKSIDEMALQAYIGPAVVVEALGTGAIGEEVLDGISLRETPRLLLKTRSVPPPATWSSEFAHLSVELAERLAAHGALLVGLDTPSVDPVDSKDLRAHHALFNAGVANLENLRLDHVDPGRYFLAAAPLLVEGMDGGPVRAVLIAPDAIPDLT
jgi:arylformamidase